MFNLSLVNWETILAHLSARFMILPWRFAGLWSSTSITVLKNAQNERDFFVTECEVSKESVNKNWIEIVSVATDNKGKTYDDLWQKKVKLFHCIKPGRGQYLAI